MVNEPGLARTRLEILRAFAGLGVGMFECRMNRRGVVALYRLVHSCIVASDGCISEICKSLRACPLLASSVGETYSWHVTVMVS